MQAKTAPFPHKKPENTLKITSKTAQNGIKTRFSASPTFKTHFWTKILEVDFFTEMAPFSTPTAEAGPGAVKRPFRRPKIGPFTAKMVFSGLQSGFFVFLDPKNGGRVTFSAFESPSTSRNIGFGPFLTFFHIFRKSSKSKPKIEIFHEGGVHGSKNLKRRIEARDLFH